MNKEKPLIFDGIDDSLDAGIVCESDGKKAVTKTVDDLTFNWRKYEYGGITSTFAEIRQRDKEVVTLGWNAQDLSEDKMRKIENFYRNRPIPATFTDQLAECFHGRYKITNKERRKIELYLINKLIGDKDED